MWQTMQFTSLYITHSQKNRATLTLLHKIIFFSVVFKYLVMILVERVYNKYEIRSVEKKCKNIKKIPKLGHLESEKIPQKCYKKTLLQMGGQFGVEYLFILDNGNQCYRSILPQKSKPIHHRNFKFFSQAYPLKNQP